MSETNNKLEIKNLSKRFGEKILFENLSLTVDGPAVLWAPSGWGKTTLLRILMGLEAPTSGSVEVGGVDICSSDDETLSGIRRRKLGYIFQEFNLIPILTAEENIIMPLLLDGKKPDKAKLRELAGFLGIELSGRVDESE